MSWIVIQQFHILSYNLWCLVSVQRKQELLTYMEGPDSHRGTSIHDDSKSWWISYIDKSCVIVCILLNFKYTPFKMLLYWKRHTSKSMNQFVVLLRIGVYEIRTFPKWRNTCSLRNTLLNEVIIESSTPIWLSYSMVS